MSATSASRSAPRESLRPLWRLLSCVRLWWRHVLLGGVLSIGATAAGLVPPCLTMPLLDDVLVPFQQGDQSQLHRVPWLLSGLGLAALMAWLLTWARTWVLAWTSERVAAELRTKTYAHLQSMSLDFFSQHRTGDLISRVSSDTDRICNFLSLHIIDFVSDVLLILMTAGVLFSICPPLAIATLSPLPFVVWLVQRVRNRLRTSFATGTEAWGGMTSVLADTIPGIRVVKAFAQEQRETDRFVAANQEVLAANDSVNRLWSLFAPLVVLLTDAGLLVVWACGVWMVLDQRITVGVLTAFVACIGRFYGRLDSMSRVAAAAQRAAASASRLFEILDSRPSVAESATPVRLPRLRGAIELDDVVFQFGDRTILDGVSLSIRPGELIGLVGPSGAGKTTLVNLVCRFYDVSTGAVRVDDVDVRDVSLRDLRQQIGLVLQEPFLFSGSVADNIAYGRPDASREEIIAAAQAAHAHGFIQQLPLGYDSPVGERGQLLSGGERQRLSIARALLIDPRILILDEATSSVDNETEREIQGALDNLVRGRTTIAIAHRLSTLHAADRLIVLDQGQIVETGTHDELLLHDGVYRRLYDAQFRNTASPPVSPVSPLPVADAINLATTLSEYGETESAPEFIAAGSE